MNEIIMVPLRMLRHHPDNPRSDLGDVTELADSIRSQGILQNLTVIPAKRPLTDREKAAFTEDGEEPPKDITERYYYDPNKDPLYQQYSENDGDAERAGQDFARGFEAEYEAARDGRSVEESKSIYADLLTDDQRQVAREAGQRAYERAEAEAEERNAQEARGGIQDGAGGSGDVCRGGTGG